MIALRDWNARILRNLSRVTTSGGFIAQIDGLRFVAISTVFLHHLNSQVLRYVVPAAHGTPPLGRGAEVEAESMIGKLWGQGGVGVLVFFTISGFILGLPFARQHLCGGPKVRLAPYLIRRVTRLEPPFVIAMLGAFLAIRLLQPTPEANLPHLLASLAYLHYPIYGEVSPILGISWTLEIEVQFYLLAPLLSVVFSIRPTAARRMAMLAIIGAFAVLKATKDPELESLRLGKTIVGYLHCFMLGFLIADVYLTAKRPEPTRAGRHLFDAMGFTGLLALLWPTELPFQARVVLFVIGCPMLFAAAFGRGSAQRLLSGPWIATIGGMCYSIYLLHLPLLYAWVKYGGVHFKLPMAFGEAANLLLQLLICLPVVGLPCVAYFVLVERPCMDRDWPAKLWSRVRARSAQSS